MTKTLDQKLEASQRRRLASEDRYLVRLEKRELEASKLIGELSSGKLYIWPAGGKYREGGRYELIAFLMRNKYV